jgi:NADP-dependent 3-hydroxy acid dehydrogenase YdfG
MKYIVNHSKNIAGAPEWMPFSTLSGGSPQVTKRHVRVSLVEPGATATELAGHNRPEVLETMRTQVTGIQPMRAEDIADAVAYIVTRPRHVAVNEMLIRATEQELQPPAGSQPHALGVEHDTKERDR